MRKFGERRMTGVTRRKMWFNYTKRKEEVMDHYDAVKTAQLVDVDEIPLPGNDNESGGNTGDIPLPPSVMNNMPAMPKVGILKKSSVLLVVKLVQL